MKFTLQAQDKLSKARAGVLETAHGKIETPIFMPVGTAGTVKAVHQHELVNDIQAQIILGNTYHLYLRPGLDVLNKASGFLRHELSRRIKTRITPRLRFHYDKTNAYGNYMFGLIAEAVKDLPPAAPKQDEE